MGSKKKPPYDADFREGAVRIVVETGRPAGEVAEELGINPGTLHSWVSRWRRNGTTSSDRPVQPTAASGGGGRVVAGPRAAKLHKPSKWHSVMSAIPRVPGSADLTSGRLRPEKKGRA
ncbi:transposase [Streptomyces sp. SCSIO 30461]|uniref:transposase n=1 Tax=Streptomyces sp. SCSIO 30461 TaxID=3118085 RepID=UPI0030D38E3F